MGASTLEQVINYSTPGNFTFDSALVEFVGSSVRLKDLRPTGATFHSKFETKDGNWGDGDLTGTFKGDASVSDGQLNSTANSPSAIEYDGASNMPSANKGCVRFEFTPNYSGSRTSYLFAAAKGASDIDNMVRIFQIGTLIRWDIYNDAGASVKTVQTGNGFNPVAGTKYEIELNWDCDLGEYRLFINGVNINGLQTSAAATLGNRGIMRLGDNYLTTNVAGADGKFDNLVVFDDVQHTANYTPFQEIPFQYSKDSPSVVNNSGVTGDALDGLVENTSSVPTDTEIRYIIQVNGQDKYWDGDSWENSDGSFSQSNDLATIETNKAALDLALGATIKVKVLLVSDTGAARPSLDTVTLSYNFFNTQAEPATCTVWGFYRDVSGKGVEGATVSFILQRANKQYREAGDAIIEKTVAVTTDVNGRFESDLIRTSEFETAGTYEITVKKDADSLETTVLDSDANPIAFSVPDSADVNITSLITSLA